MRKLVVAVAVLVFTAGLGLGVAAAKDAPAGPVEVTNFGKKAPVAFEHAKHKDVAKCEQCHHKGLDDPKCGGCHTLKGEGDAPKIKDAFHKKGKGACYACHFQKNPKVGKKLKCGDCHKK
ncbi:MAG: hypothetical protein Kow0092_01700 [Deferrisomatales bacterium]